MWNAYEVHGEMHIEMHIHLFELYAYVNTYRGAYPLMDQMNTILLKRNAPTLTINISASLFPILKNFEGFVNYRKFPVASCNPHSSILLCLEMRAI